MTKLKLGAVPDDKPVKLTITLTAEQHALLVEYAEIHAAQFQRRVPPERLVPPILERFIRTDRAFAKARHGRSRGRESAATTPAPLSRGKDPE